MIVKDRLIPSLLMVRQERFVQSFYVKVFGNWKRSREPFLDATLIHCPGAIRWDSSIDISKLLLGSRSLSLYLSLGEV